MWALAKANLFWMLHSARLRMPGRACPAPMFATYRTDACLMHHRLRANTSHVPTYPADASVSMTEAASDTSPPQPGANHAHSRADEPPCAVHSIAPPAVKATTRTSCTDLDIASNPRALIAT
eukprot:177731-Pleurochrysis_carterae.AAC.1